MRLIAVFFCLLLVSCQTTPRLQPTGLISSAFWKDQKHRASTWNYLGGKLDLGYKSSGEDVSGGGRFVLRAPNKLYLDIRDPFGRSHYILASDGKTFTAFFPRNHYGYVDPTLGKRYFKKFLGMNVSLDEVLQLWLGIIPDSFGGKTFESWEWDGGEGGYRGTAKRYTAVVDGKSAGLKSLTFDSGSEEISVTYADEKPCCSEGATANLARSVTLQTRNGATKLEIGFESLSTAPPPLGDGAFSFTMPPGTQKKRLEH